jgi:diacylglycerol kinase family enzyme
MHNPCAGHGKHRKKELMAALAKVGHHAIYQSTKKRGYKKALKNPGDVVVVAGGDGTVTKIARRLIDTGIPLSVLPLGTANNLARTLGFVGRPEEVVARLEDGEKHSFDVGVARGPWGTRYFFEGAGAGLPADYVRTAKKEDKKPISLSKDHEMSRHVSLLRRLLHDYSAREWKVEIDGKDFSDTYILWEAMNVHSVGPALYLAPRATTKDAEFDFVCVRESDRSLLLDHFDARLKGKKSKFPLPVRRFRRLRVVWEGSTLHFDDKLWPSKGQRPPSPSEIEITVKPSALIILQPAPGQ